jgi:hypothetical protein
MPRHIRHTKPPAILPGREHIMLMEAMAKTFSALMPEELRFTVAMFDAHGRMAGYISNSGRPFAFSEKRRKPFFRQRRRKTPERTR